MEMAIDLNRKLSLPPGDHQTVKVGKDDFLPHLSLAMGITDSNKVSDVAADLESLASEIRPLGLATKEVHTVEYPNGRKASVLTVEVTDQLRSLHEAVMDLSQKHFSYRRVEPGMYLGSPPPSERSCRYLKRFREEHAFENFSPHITLGRGVVENPVKPTPFTVHRLALCRLGVSNTCRQILAEISL